MTVAWKFIAADHLLGEAAWAAMTDVVVLAAAKLAAREAAGAAAWACVAETEMNADLEETLMGLEP